MEFLSIPLLSPPVTGFIKRGNDIGIEDSAFMYSPGCSYKKICCFNFSFLHNFLLYFYHFHYLSAALLEAI